MSPFGAVSRNRGSRNPPAYKSILNPVGTLSCAFAGRPMTRGRLIARTFELGGGKSATVILRRTPGASLVQSPIAVLPVSKSPARPCSGAVLSKIAQAKTTSVLRGHRRDIRLWGAQAANMSILAACQDVVDPLGHSARSCPVLSIAGKLPAITG